MANYILVAGRREEVQTIITKYENKLKWEVPALKKRKKEKKREVGGAGH